MINAISCLIPLLRMLSRRSAAALSPASDYRVFNEFMTPAILLPADVFRASIIEAWPRPIVERPDITCQADRSRLLQERKNAFLTSGQMAVMTHEDITHMAIARRSRLSTAVSSGSRRRSIRQLT